VSDVVWPTFAMTFVKVRLTVVIIDNDLIIVKF